MAWFGDWFGDWFGEWFGDGSGGTGVTVNVSRSDLTLSSTAVQVTATAAVNSGGWPWRPIVRRAVAEPARTKLNLRFSSPRLRAVKTAKIRATRSTLTLLSFGSLESTGSTIAAKKSWLQTSSTAPEVSAGATVQTKRTAYQLKSKPFETRTGSTAAVGRQDFKIKTFSAKVRVESEEEDEFLLALFAVLDTEE